MAAGSYLEFDSELIRTSMDHVGAPVSLEVLVRKPESNPPYPTVVFNHGSMGRSRRKDGYRHAWQPARFAKLLNSWGWMILLPQRRGIGESGGLYEEGFDPNKNEYTCDSKASIMGFERATEDMGHIVAYVSSRQDVETKRLVLAGQSRGGALAITYAARKPEMFSGAFSFVGGWMGQGCDRYDEINRAVYLGAGEYGKNTLWLHGSRDRFYKLSHCREIFERYESEGGQGSFNSYTTGHSLIVHQQHYRDELKRDLAEL